jgi:hypothetical protein
MRCAVWVIVIEDDELRVMRSPLIAAGFLPCATGDAAEFLRLNPSCHVGGWKDGAGVFYLDAVLITQGADYAQRLGKATQQRAMYDMARGKVVNL